MRSRGKRKRHKRGDRRKRRRTWTEEDLAKEHQKSRVKKIKEDERYGVIQGRYNIYKCCDALY